MSWLRLFGLFLLVMTVLGISMELYDRFSLSAHQKRLKFVLNLEEIPASVHDIHCPPSKYFTDLVIDCTLKFAASDLEKLLARRDFQKISPNVYLTEPKGSKYGGEVRVTVDPVQGIMTVFYYEE